jgi:hypothetical protein
LPGSISRNPLRARIRGRVLFYAVLGKHLQGRYTTVDMMTWAFLIAALMWALINPVWALPVELHTMARPAVLPLPRDCCHGHPLRPLLFSLRYLEASRSSLTSMVEPVVGAGRRLALAG